MTGQELERPWPWSALAAPSPRGGVVPRGSGGREKRQKRGAKGTGFPTGECRVLGARPSPSPGPSSWSGGFWLLPTSLQLLSPALELSWSLELLETEGSKVWSCVTLVWLPNSSELQKSHL